MSITAGALGPTQVNVQPAIGVEGDFCDHNPRFTVDAGAGGMVAGASGVIIGRFAWAENPPDADGTPSVVSNTGNGPVTGFVHREQQGLIVDYLASSGMKVQAGFGVVLHSGGGFFVRNAGSGQALMGQKAYADLGDGSVTFAATGAPSAGASVTGTIAAATSAFTGAIDDSVLTVSAVGSGTIVPGTTVSGSGVASGTLIVEQLTGTEGGVGTYAVSIPEQSVASEAMTGAYGLFTAVSGLTGEFDIGSILSGAGGGGVTAGTTIYGKGTGTGGLGTYYVTPSQTVTSTTIAATGNVETKWVAMSTGLPGELVKISDHVLG